jgi:hypothetical protein
MIYNKILSQSRQRCCFVLDPKIAQIVLLTCVILARSAVAFKNAVHS